MSGQWQLCFTKPHTERHWLIPQQLSWDIYTSVKERWTPNIIFPEQKEDMQAKIVAKLFYFRFWILTELLFWLIR